MNNILLTITGPSLTGKSRLAQLLSPYKFEEVVSTTTRPAREGEIDGVHYNFVSVEKFKSLIDNNLMIENTPVGKNFYGVSKPAFDDVVNKGKNGVIVIEPLGANKVEQYCLQNNIKLLKIFVDNPTQLLIERFLQRYKNDKLALDATYATRIIDMINKEPKDWIEPAYSGVHHYDKIFSSFNIENENQVVEGVLDLVSKALNKKNIYKP